MSLSHFISLLFLPLDGIQVLMYGEDGEDEVDVEVEEEDDDDEDEVTTSFSNTQIQFLW